MTTNPSSVIPIAKRAKDPAVDEKLALVTFNPDSAPHIEVNDEVCSKCGIDRVCQIICPAQNYTWDENAKHMAVSTESCFECGTCRVACTEDAIIWNWPQGGFGIQYAKG